MVLYELNAVDFCKRAEFDEYFMLNCVGKWHGTLILEIATFTFEPKWIF